MDKALSEGKSLSCLRIVPIDFSEACLFVERYHRHHKAPQGHKFSIALSLDNIIVGVAIVGRPVARHLDKGWTLEVTRLCTNGEKNACSKLYAACWRITREMGYTQLITYTLDNESGASLKAAGWKCLGSAGGKSWNRHSRPRIDKSPQQLKIKYAAAIDNNQKLKKNNN